MSSRQSRSAAAVVLGIAMAVFWRTAYPTITWWDSSSYSLAASTLGIASAPGSLLLTLLGWPVARLPGVTSPAHALNLLAGALAAVAVTLVYMVALRLLRASGRTSGGAPSSGAIGFGVTLGALTFAFSDTLWDHAIKFTPYVLSAVFTGLILWTMLRWWEDAERPDAWRRLALLGLLFGLDFSVHRTNALLLPGALAWIVIRSPQTLRQRRALVGGASGLVAGLSVQLAIIPIAALTRSPLNWWNPSNWSRFWSYISLEQLGGGFLVSLFPRNASISSVQIADFIRVLGANFFHWSASLGVLGMVPALAALLGLIAVWRANARLGAAWALVLFLHAATTVLYFNIPANYFRPFDRHYLPVCVTIAVLAASGLGVAMEWATSMPRVRKPIVAIPAAALVIVAPIAQLRGNWGTHDASRRYFTRDYAVNALERLPPNAIYFTVGDNDTFPVMYAQAVEGVRRDVTIINLSVANMSGIPEQLRRSDPSFPVALASNERRTIGNTAWTDTSVVVPVTGSAEQFGLAPGTQLLPAITLDVRPSSGTHMQPAEITLLDIVRTNRWRRPLTFAITGGASALGWLSPYARLDGLYSLIVPVREPRTDPRLLRTNLLEHTKYRGYADPSVVIDDVTRRMAFLYYAAASRLIEADARDAADRCQADARSFLAAMPSARLDLPIEYRSKIESGCR